MPPRSPLPVSLEDQDQYMALQDLYMLNDVLQLDAATDAMTAYELGVFALILKRLSVPALRAVWPPLATFARTWKQRFPLSPAIRTLPDWVAACAFPREHDVRVTSHWDDEDQDIWPQSTPALVIEVRTRPGASRDVILEQLKDILAKHAAQPDRNAPRPHPQRDRSKYEEAFRAYELRTHGATLPAIAQQLWPNEWQAESHDAAARKKLVQRARDYAKRGGRWIREEQK
jgi:hypothetical protein